MVKAKLSKITVVICVFTVLFVAFSSYPMNRVRTVAQSMYEHPYTVTNTARAMRSRLIDMKQFVNIFLTKSFESEEKARQLFEARYKLQNEAIDIIRESYLGPVEDITALRKAMDDLIAIQDDALQFIGQRSEESISAFIEEEIYPCYDAVNNCLTKIIDSSDERIFRFKNEIANTAVVSIGTTLLLMFFIIFLTIYSNMIEQRNIKDLKARERELRDALLVSQKANSAKKEFLSRMSHEIRTPMNAIIGMTTIAGAHLENPDRLKDCLAKIAFSSRHLLSLINDVLDMSKIEAGKLTINQAPFKLQQITESVISVIYSQTDEQGKNFECDIEDGMQETFIGDFLRINQILLNLLSNAVKFTPRGGTIRLKIRQLMKKNGVTILQFVVSDTGIGMTEEFLNRLFLPFEQADHSTSQNYGGTGLGMAITHNLVELLDGSINVKSRLGEGTTFTVDLPVDLPEEAMEYRTLQLETLRVLVVDDENYDCTHANLLLKRLGITSQYVKSGHEAIRAVMEAYEKGIGYDVCIVDWRMPGMDGVEVTRKIREKLGSDTIIIIISAYDWSEIESEARKAGVDAFIAKPLLESTLYNVLISLFGSIPSAEKSDAIQKDCIGKRFLLVEDNTLNMEIAFELLNMTGAEIDCATNGREAIEKFEASSPGHYDIIFMDVQMPVMDGYTATRKIREGTHPDAKIIPIIAMTANTFIEDIDAAYDAGMNGHIPKPIDVKTFYGIIANLLGGERRTST